MTSDFDKDPSTHIMLNYEYHREIGGYRPHFEAVPADYYPLSCLEVFYYSVAVILAIGIGLGILIGFIYWVLATGLNTYVIVWVVIFLVFVVIMFVLLYFGGKDRITQEKLLMEESRRKE